MISHTVKGRVMAIQNFQNLIFSKNQVDQQESCPRAIFLSTIREGGWFRVRRMGEIESDSGYVDMCLRDDG